MKAHDKVSRDIVLEKARRTERETKSKYKDMLARINALERERDAFRTISQVQAVKSIRSIPSTGQNEATALVMASDWHVEELVRPESVSGKNKYTLDIAEARANEFFVAVVKLLQKEARQIAIPNIVLFLGGDFITGNIHEDGAQNCQLKPIQATMFAKRLIIAGVKYLLSQTTCKVTIVCCVGNHPRITHRVHWSNEQGNNLEFFMYHAIAGEFEKEKRIHFVIGEGYHTYLNVYGMKLRFHHGHAIKYLGGIGGLFVPALRAIAQWNRGGGVDLDLFGHHHSQVNGGNFLCNGSMIGYNAFAVSIKAPYEPPKQTFALIDRKRGLTSVIPIVFSR